MNKMRLTYLCPLFGIFFLFLFSKCKKENLDDCFKGTGARTSETRDINGFARIKMEDKLDVYFTQSTDSSFSVTIEAGKHLIPLVKTEVIDGVLHIKNENKCNFMRSYKKGEITVRVKAPHLYYVTNDAVGNFYSSNTLTENTIEYDIQNSGDISLDVNCNLILGHMHGAGDVTLTGATANHSVSSVGQSFINAEALTAAYTFIYYNSSGKAKIKTTGQLDAEIHNSGNVYYTGNPGTVNDKEYAKGKLIPF